MYLLRQNSKITRDFTCLFYSISSNETGNSGMEFRNYVYWIWENDVNGRNTFHLRNCWAKKSTVTNAGEKPKVAAAIKLDPSQYKPLDCLRSCSFLVKAINELLVWLPIIVWWVTTGYILLIIKNEYQWKLDYIKVISNTSLKTSSIYIACLSWDRKQEMARTLAMIYREQQQNLSVVTEDQRKQFPFLLFVSGMRLRQGCITIWALINIWFKTFNIASFKVCI